MIVRILQATRPVERVCHWGNRCDGNAHNRSVRACLHLLHRHRWDIIRSGLYHFRLPTDVLNVAVWTIDSVRKIFDLSIVWIFASNSFIEAGLSNPDSVSCYENAICGQSNTMCFQQCFDLLVIHFFHSYKFNSILGYFSSNILAFSFVFFMKSW